MAHDKAECCTLAVRAGVNIELPEPDCYLNLTDLVRAGTLQESELDELVGPMLLWKFKLGLFDDPYVDPDAAERLVGSDAHRPLARQAARETITLLRNENGVLPLDPTRQATIAVIGPNAHRLLLGGYSGVPKVNVSVLEGIQARVAKGVTVRHAEGCRITIGGSWNEDRVVASDPADDTGLIAEAVEVARDADVIVLAVGGNEQTAREAWSVNHLGDTSTLELVGRQEELIRAMIDTGKPVVALVFGGRPLAITTLAERAGAVLQCWYLGQETGGAIADVLFGDFNPGGKLPMTMPRSAGHIPAFYNYKPSARLGYLFGDVSPLFAFGFGLSYTTFRLDSVRLARERMSRSESTTVHVDVTNTGSRAGTEVVQVYIRDRVSSVTRPVKELKGFAKVPLEVGETRTVAIEITPASLAFYDINMDFVVEPGEFEIMVGTSSRDADLQTVILHVTP